MLESHVKSLIRIEIAEMGLRPVFNNDGSNVFHFTYEDDNEFITFELFNRKNACIGKST